MNGIDMNPLDIVYQNFPHCTEWSDDSFLGILYEESRIDMDAYWKLERALVQLTQNEVDYPRHLSWPVFRIFSVLPINLKANIQPENGYKIQGFNNEQSWNFTERLQLVFEGFFRGDPPDLKLAFDERNPLLE
jgi:hypothetical protein